MAFPYSIDIGRTAGDHLSIASAPAGGAVICYATQPIQGSSGYWINSELIGSNWSSVLAVVPGSTSVRIGWDIWQYPSYGGNITLSNVTDTVSAGVGTGWLFIGLQIIIGAPNTVFRLWHKYGPSGTTVKVGEWTQANSGFTQGGGAASEIQSLNLADPDAGDGVQESNFTAARVYARATEPSIAELDVIFGTLAADVSAWSDSRLVFENSAAVVADQSGHSRPWSVTGTAYQGAVGPLDAAGGQLSAPEVTTGATTLSAPALAQTQVLSAGEVLSQAVLASPDLMVSGPAFDHLVFDPAVFGDVDSSPGYDMSAPAITTGATTLSAPALAQVHALTAAAITTGSMSISAPSLSAGGTGDAVGAHALAYKHQADPPDTLTTPARTTQSGGVLLYFAGRYPIASGSNDVPGDNKENAFAALGPRMSWSDWPDGSIVASAATAIAGGAGHVLSLAPAQAYELTSFLQEILGGTSIQDYKTRIYTQAEQSATLAAPSVDASGPAVIVSMFFATVTVYPGFQEFATTNGFSVVEAQVDTSNYVTGAMAVRHVGAAGTYSTNWIMSHADYGVMFTVAVGTTLAPSSGASLSASPITTGATTLSAPALAQTHALSAGAISAGPATMGAPAIAQTHAFTASAISCDPATLTAAVMAQVHVLSAPSVVAGPAALGAPSIAQVHALSAPAIATGSTTVSAPTLAQAHALAAAEVASGSTTIGSPALAQSHALSAAAVTAGPASIGPPAIGQVHALSAAAVVAGPATLSAPTIGTTGVYGFSADPVTTGATTLSAPAMAQVHSLTAGGVSTGATTVAAPPIAQNHALSAGAITAGPVTVSAPDLTASAAVYSLSAPAISAGPATIGTPAIAQGHTLAAGGVASVPSLGVPALQQTHALVAGAMSAAQTSIAAPALQMLVNYALAANPILAGPATLSAPSLAVYEVAEYPYIEATLRVAGNISSTVAVAGNLSATLTVP